MMEREYYANLPSFYSEKKEKALYTREELSANTWSCMQ